jgi:hypothetical protein
MGDDGRTYIRVHDGMPDHPKVETLSDRAFRLLVETWCWSSRHLTDGRVPRNIWLRRGTPKARRELVTAGLVEDLAGDGVQMHDYLEHQRSRADVEQLTAERRAKQEKASVKANHTRWHVGPKGRPSADCDLCQSSDRASGSDSAADPALSARSDPDRSPSGSLIGRGIGIGREGGSVGRGSPDSNARDQKPPPAPIFDPDDPRCADHAHIPPGQPVPNCRGCAEVRRQARAQAAADTATADEERARRRELRERCPDCDETGMRDFGELGVGRCSHPTLLEEARS